jgi:hypothetical protein
MKRGSFAPNTCNAQCFVAAFEFPKYRTGQDIAALFTR